MGQVQVEHVLNFHGIGTPGRPLDPGEDAVWVTEERFLRILDMIAARPDRERIRITFDDSNDSDLGIAAPALAERGLGAVFFILTGRIGARGSLDADGIAGLAEMGFGIGSHGIAHVPWTSLDAAALETELGESRDTLAAILDRPVAEAGIPFGRYNSRVLAALRRAGYASAYSSDGGAMRRDRFLRPRTSVRATTTVEDAARVLDGRMPPLRRLRRAGGMLKRRLI